MKIKETVETAAFVYVAAVAVVGLTKLGYDAAKALKETIQEKKNKN